MNVILEEINLARFNLKPKMEVSFLHFVDSV